MAQDTKNHQALGDVAARQLANATKTPPRWRDHAALAGPPARLEAGRGGHLRVNRVKDESPIEVVCGSRDERTLPETFVDYEEKPREYTLNAITTVARRSHPRLRPLQQPLRPDPRAASATIENVKERQESELINNADYGLSTTSRRRSASRPARARRRPTISTS